MKCNTELIYHYKVLYDFYFARNVSLKDNTKLYSYFSPILGGGELCISKQKHTKYHRCPLQDVFDSSLSYFVLDFEISVTVWLAPENVEFF